ncbi:MAG: hypothetical protein EBY24_22745, partial [Betaproteobacteria bacterium]|nr:hypothetical protein [Betaproteobacteria bacterium]
MTFAHPFYLLLLLLLPLLAWLKGQRGRAPAFLYSSLKLVEGLTRARRSRAGTFLSALRWLSLAFLIVALAQVAGIGAHKFHQQFLLRGIEHIRTDAL